MGRAIPTALGKVEFLVVIIVAIAYVEIVVTRGAHVHALVGSSTLDFDPCGRRPRLKVEPAPTQHKSPRAGKRERCEGLAAHFWLSPVWQTQKPSPL